MSEKPDISFTRIRANVPAWLWKALYHAARDAGPDTVPIIIVEAQPRPFVILDIDDYNRLVRRNGDDAQ